MKNNTIHESLQEYLKNTPKEKVLKDWNEFQHLDNEGITINDFLENQKKIDEKGRPLTYWGELEELRQETLEEFSRRRFNEQKLDTYTSYNIEDAIKEGAKWQQERMYSEKEVHSIIKSYHNTVKNNPINITYSKWFEKFKKK